MEAERTLIAGLGSAFGDDRVGWLAAERLAARFPPGVVVALRSPAELLDKLPGVERLHVIDACRGAGPPGTILCRDWPSPEFANVSFANTHDLSLPAALHLAATLALLPPRVTLWAIEIADAADPNDPTTVAAPLSAAVMRAVEQLICRFESWTPVNLADP